MSSEQGKSPPVQGKEPYGTLDMVTCRLSFVAGSVQSTPADNTLKRVWQYIEKEKDRKTWNRALFILRGHGL